LNSEAPKTVVHVGGLTEDDKSDEEGEASGRSHSDEEDEEIWLAEREPNAPRAKVPPLATATKVTSYAEDDSDDEHEHEHEQEGGPVRP
jgi:hypothetical protein